MNNVQKLITDNLDIKELDINPLKLTPGGLIAVDAHELRKRVALSKNPLELAKDLIF